jgi:hypothetical protein
MSANDDAAGSGEEDYVRRESVDGVGELRSEAVSGK